MPLVVSTITPCFRGERYLPRFLDSVARQTVFEDLEIVLAHNEPSPEAFAIIEAFQATYPGKLKHLVVDPVEPVSASMNRCIREASAGYVTIWNVDDLRLEDSIERQVRMLEASPDTALVYGDMIVVTEFGSTTGASTTCEPPFEREEFLRSFHCSAFPMWRKSVCERAGLFDEQLKSGADFDLMVRIAAIAGMDKVNGYLGYYLNEGLGLSTGSSLQPIERTVIELRYGIFDKIEPQWLPAARAYRGSSILFDGEWHRVGDFFPDYDAFMAERRRRFAYRLRHLRWGMASCRRLLRRLRYSHG